jgi:hypothetical protein
MPERTKIVPVKLPDGVVVNIEAVTFGSREQDVANLTEVLPFEQVSATIESIAKAVMAPIKKVQPSKASVELGVTVGLESGQLTALIMKGTGEANLKITFEWEKDKEKDA